ncbi:heme NO-binding domain-containing protein [Flavivirga spongiicola]|uniref:Heme NO-binding domain-containing protein n=1 Tax=Flavivirga spongiicola TaxID=421621 RepID=A0ABU7XYD6_9FLAO|nr:heme NO-binding domain-containing protein [Flavivirga sp. MEBiC05379]MDO5980787.1 heme NO-binding domain-containing protein [Flavivirga sp. MEBiC05379]
MKGIIFNITESFIIDYYGEEVLNEILKECELHTKEPYVGPGTYPDSDMMEIITRSSEKLSINISDFFVKLGRYTLYKLVERFPNFVMPYDCPKEFLKTVDSIVHVEVQKLYQGTQLPVFQYAEPNKNELIITYYSKRKLYSFMEGLIDGVASYFNSSIEQRHTIYTKNDLEFCDFHLKFNE